VRLDPPPETNMVYFQADGWDAASLAGRLGAEGVLCFDEPGGRVRWVTHYGIERRDVEEAVAVTRSVISAGS